VGGELEDQSDDRLEGFATVFVIALLLRRRDRDEVLVKIAANCYYACPTASFRRQQHIIGAHCVGKYRQY
jgi:hypothetical protein